MFAPLLTLAAVVAAAPGFHVVESARTEQLMVVGEAGAREALFVVTDEQVPSAELRAVRLEGAGAFVASRVVFRADVIAGFDVDGSVALVAVDGERSGVALVPLAGTSSPGFVTVPGLRELVSCGGRRIATAFVDAKMTAHDLSGVAVGARLDRPPPTPPSSPAAVLAQRAEPLALSCNEGTLAAAGPKELVVFDGAAPTRVPWSRVGDWVRGVFALPGGDLVVWSQEAISVIDRKGARKAALGGRRGSVQIVRTARGARLLTHDASYALPHLDDRRAVDGLASAIAAIAPNDDTALVALTQSGLRARGLVPAFVPPTMLREPKSIARRADGKRFAVGDVDGDVIVFDRPRPADDWQPIATLHDHQEEVFGLAYVSAAAAQTAGDALVSVGGDGFVHVYVDAAGSPLGRGLARVRSIPFDLNADSVAFDVGRGRLAVGSAEAIAVVDVGAGTVRLLGPIPREQYGSLKVGGFSKDGAHLAFVDDVGRVRVYALGDGREDRRIAGQHMFVAYDAQGRLVRATREELLIEGRAAPLETSFSRVALDAASGELWGWSWSGSFGPLGKAPRQAPWHVADLAIDGDRVITVGPDEQVLSWPSAGTAAPRARFGVKRVRVEAVAFVDDDVAVAFEGARMRVVGPGHAPRELKPARCSRPDEGELDLTPAGLALTAQAAKAQRTLVGATTLGEVRWNLATGALTCPPDLKLDGYDKEAAGFTADGRAVLVAANDGVVVVGAKKTKLKRGADEGASVDAAVVTGDSVVVYVDGGSAIAVRVTDGAEVARTRAADLAALPGGRVLLGRWPMKDASDDDDAPHAIAIWQPGAGPPRVITRAHAWTNGLLASPDGTHFIHTVDQGEVWVRSTDTGAVRAVVAADVVEAVAFSADGARFVVASAGVVAVYDLDGRKLWSLDPRP
jgi:hypothetical protein